MHAQQVDWNASFLFLQLQYNMRRTKQKLFELQDKLQVFDLSISQITWKWPPKNRRFQLEDWNTHIQIGILPKCSVSGEYNSIKYESLHLLKRKWNVRILTFHTMRSSSLQFNAHWNSAKWLFDKTAHSLFSFRFFFLTRTQRVSERKRNAFLHFFCIRTQKQPLHGPHTLLALSFESFYPAAVARFLMTDTGNKYSKLQ